MRSIYLRRHELMVNIGDTKIEKGTGTVVEWTLFLLNSSAKTYWQNAETHLQLAKMNLELRKSILYKKQQSE
jgi:hypothetical protein